MKRLSPILVAAALLLAGAQAAAFAERYTDRIEKTLATGPDVAISLGNTNGSVSVEAWDGDSVELVAEKRVEAGNAGEAKKAFEGVDIIIRETSGRVEIETKLPSASQGFVDWILGRGRNASVRYELRVPRGAELELHTVNGNLTTEGAAGLQYLQSTNGRIQVDNAENGVEARTTNGSIRVEVSDGAAQPDIELGSTNGGITLYLPDDIEGQINARTVNGRVKTDLPVTVHGKTQRRRLKGEINGGGASDIEISTTNGSIQISASAGS